MTRTCLATAPQAGITGVAALARTAPSSRAVAVAAPAPARSRSARFLAATPHARPRLTSIPLALLRRALRSASCRNGPIGGRARTAAWRSTAAAANARDGARFWCSRLGRTRARTCPVTATTATTLLGRAQRPPRAPSPGPARAQWIAMLRTGARLGHAPCPAAVVSSTARARSWPAASRRTAASSALRW